ncbi:MAG: tRNA lysidine(34) synthetase TilS [Lachnospiraceae bacterium]|nr:tRNA lysidine(34) synthetase TilS [Lachnospiraceae bacterium]
MQKKVEAYIRQWNMVEPGMQILVGFSGGADSTALLQILWEYAKEHDAGVCALHVNHGIRGMEAERDQEFCEAFCRERKIPLRIVRVNVPEIAGKEGISTEEAGRNVRYEAFGQALEDGFADRVALAHHQNDQAETMLFHLMRGTGIKGLRGMEPVRLPYIRPFLCVERQEIINWLVGEKISWVEDSTNQELEYTRNQIRHQVLAPIEQIRSGSISRMSSTAVQLLEIEDYLEQEAARLWDVCICKEGDGYAILLDAFAQIHPVMKKMIVMECLGRVNGGRKNLETVHLEQVCRLAEGKRGSRVTLPGNCFAVLGYGKLLIKKGYGIENTGKPVYCEPDGEYQYMGQYFRFTLKNRTGTEKIPLNCYTKWFDYDKIKTNIVLRTRQPGDYLEITGGSHKKLKDYLIDCKIPREERDRCILLADEQHIIWVTGMRISERYKVTDETKRILIVQKIEDGGTRDGETSCGSHVI